MASYDKTLACAIRLSNHLYDLSKLGSPVMSGTESLLSEVPFLRESVVL